MTGAPPGDDLVLPAPRAQGRAWLTRVVMLALAAYVVVMLARQARYLDLADVWAAMGHLAWWHMVVLFVVLLVRQVLSAAPLAIYVPGVGLYRATVNDLTTLTATFFVPAPGDMVVRTAMFRTWGFDVSRAAAGTVMNSVTWFILRFGAPAAGFLLLPYLGVPLGLRALDILSLLVSAALLVGVLLVVRAESQAVRVGRLAGRAVGLVRKGADPEVWAEAFRRFQQGIATGFASQFPRSVLVTAGMILADLALLTLALRFVGVPAGAVSVLVIAAALFFAYPLTVFPMQGAGLVDAAVVAAVVEAAGPDVAEPAVAALLIWRLYTLGGPLVLGGLGMLVWRRLAPRHPSRSADQDI